MTKTSKSYDWIVMNANTQRFECLRCGKHAELPALPMEVGNFLDYTEVFIKHHKHCK